MTTFYGFKKLTNVEDWRGLAGANKWVPSRSAYELAQCWHQSRGLPEPIKNVLNSSGHDLLSGLSVDLCLVEKPVFLDSQIGPSMTDLMAYGRNAKGDAVILAVEGKADEPFASRVSTWLLGDTSDPSAPAEPRPTRLRRLKFLSKHLSLAISPDSPLRYQLLHRTVSAVLEAQLHGAAAAIVLIHVFGQDTSNNHSDFSEFIRQLGGREATKGAVLGPYALGEQGNLPTYFLWWQQP